MFVKIFQFPRNDSWASKLLQRVWEPGPGQQVRLQERAPSLCGRQARGGGRLLVKMEGEKEGTQLSPTILKTVLEQQLTSVTGPFGFVGGQEQEPSESSGLSRERLSLGSGCRREVRWEGRTGNWVPEGVRFREGEGPGPVRGLPSGGQEMSSPSDCVASHFPCSPTPPSVSVSHGAQPPRLGCCGPRVPSPCSEEHRGRKSRKMQHKTHPRRFGDPRPMADLGSEDWDLLHYLGTERPGYRGSTMQPSRDLRTFVGQRRSYRRLTTARLWICSSNNVLLSLKCM